MKKFLFLLLAMVGIIILASSGFAAESDWRDLSLADLLKYQPVTEERQEYIEKLLLSKDNLIKETQESKLPQQDKDNLADLIQFAVEIRHIEVVLDSAVEGNREI